jgi:Kef-type K+ transport system membrane component KefB
VIPVQSPAIVAESAVGARAEELVVHLLIQVIAILVATRVVVRVARKLGQTDVSGEILAGLVLGPSCLGALAPVAMHRLFTPATSPIFVGLAQVGLVLLMFQIGLEFRFKTSLSASKPAVAVVSLAGMLVPLALGWLSALWFYQHLAEPRPQLLGFRLFFGIAMSITAIPILGRIFMELRLSHTRTAALTIGAAAIDDVAGWLLLGVVTLIVRQQFSTELLLARIGALAAYVAFVFMVARPLLKRAIGAHLERHRELQPGAVAWILLIVFVSGTLTSLIGVFAIIGGFVVGAALHDDRRLVEQWKTRVSPLVNAFFLPIFFAYTGLRTDLGSLSGAGEWGVCLMVMGVAFVSKLAGAYAGARLVGESNRSALAIGVCMNTRALMELVAINIGYDLGVIPRNMFAMLVIMAITSTFMATPLIRWLLRGQESSSAVVPEQEGPARHAA